MDDSAKRRLGNDLRGLILMVQDSAATVHAHPRSLQRVLALLWSAYDELEHLARATPLPSPFAMVES